jgi:hypothetical protein
LSKLDEIIDRLKAIQQKDQNRDDSELGSRGALAGGLS